MHKREFIKVAAKKAGMSQKDFEKMYDAMLETITEQLSEGNKVQLTGFGTFKTSQRKARKGRNPATGKALQIPARTVALFSPGAQLKRLFAAMAPKKTTKRKKKARKTELTQELEPSRISAAQFKTFAK